MTKTPLEKIEALREWGRENGVPEIEDLTNELIMEFNSLKAQLKEHDDQAIKSVMKTLSFSEVDALKHIFEEITGSEVLLVASKIADRVGVTRSVIVSGIRKLESAGVVYSRSLGMKGTHIKVLVPAIRSALEAS